MTKWNMAYLRRMLGELGRRLLLLHQLGHMARFLLLHWRELMARYPLLLLHWREHMAKLGEDSVGMVAT